MLMLGEYMEDFRRMESGGAGDGLGGLTGKLTPGEAFHAGICPGQTAAAALAGKEAARESGVLLHGAGVTLAPGEIIRREKDGALYRVRSRSEFYRAPRRGRLAFAQVNIERVVIP